MNILQPTFICGALRSGSTLFHVMLNSHSNITNPGEFDFLFDFDLNDGKQLDVVLYKEYLSIHRIFKSKKLSIDESLNYTELVQSFVNQLTQKNDYLTLNIHRNFNRAVKLFPDAKFIHLLRDPRDVARSSIGMNWAGNVYYGVDHWLDTERSWDKLLPLINNNQHIEIRFEELISDTLSVLNKVCEFIGVNYSDEMLNYENNSTYSKPNITLINQWKKKLSISELQNVEYKVMGMMSSRNYELSGHPVSAPGKLQVIKLNFQNSLFKIKKGIEIYGFMLYFAYRISARLGLNSWHRSLQYKISEIDKKYLK